MEASVCYPSSDGTSVCHRDVVCAFHTKVSLYVQESLSQSRLHNYYVGHWQSQVENEHYSDGLI